MKASRLKSASIELICGCMFSGKTTRLLARVRELSRTSRVACLKPRIDTRYSQTNIVSHDGQCIAAQTVPSAADLLNAAGDAEVVAIDEIHFFDDTLVTVCKQLADQGRHVICCGLDHDMWGDPFPHVARLSEISQTTVLKAICAKCQQPADRTHRKVPLKDDNLVGGAEAFEPRCQTCFRPPNAPKPRPHVPGLA